MVFPDFQPMKVSEEPLSCKKKSSKIRRKTDVKVLQIYFVLNCYRRKSNLGHTAIEFFAADAT
jgi:hypothetical protein